MLLDSYNQTIIQQTTLDTTLFSWSFLIGKNRILSIQKSIQMLPFSLIHVSIVRHVLLGTSLVNLLQQLLVSVRVCAHLSWQKPLKSQKLLAGLKEWLGLKSSSKSTVCSLFKPFAATLPWILRAHLFALNRATNLIRSDVA